MDLSRLAVACLKGVGPRKVELLARLGVRSVQDVLFHLPMRYEDRTRLHPLTDLKGGETVAVEGQIGRVELKLGRRRSLLVHLSDGTAVIVLRFFHFSAAQRAVLAPGTRLRCFGEVRRGPNGLEMIHPEYRRVSPAEDLSPEPHLTPVYPNTSGMHQASWLDLTGQALALLDRDGSTLEELLPSTVRANSGWPSIIDALRLLHRPPREMSASALNRGEHDALRRLSFEELLAHHLSLRQVRLDKSIVPAPSLGEGREAHAAFRQQLPFVLTAGQERVVAEVAGDLAGTRPMMRLVQGDVGSGKTVVAAFAALQASASGHQCAIMAPTELLAEQHYTGLKSWLGPLGVEVDWLSGRHKGVPRRRLLEKISTAQSAVVVGTHALFQNDVVFSSLGLVIIDEQHRFGVHQRLALREKGASGVRAPHQMIMTATPIPRTLAMTAYADLDVSVIDDLPPGRTPVVTVAMPDSRRDEVLDRVRLACGAGRQTYWVCTLVEDSELLQCQAAEETARVLATALHGLRVGLVHGRLKPEEKERVMAEFKAGSIDLLVATTVIEVGVDVPNASLMIIENPERLGLAQLHQLRGRVGRGSARSHCVLLYRPPLSDASRFRLNVMRHSNDGFEIARRDLQLRGPGELLGTRQTGLLRLRVADLARDESLLPKVQACAEQMLRDYPDRVPAIVDRWLGRASVYAEV